MSLVSLKIIDSTLVTLASGSTTSMNGFISADVNTFLYTFVVPLMAIVDFETVYPVILPLLSLDGIIFLLEKPLLLNCSAKFTSSVSSKLVFPAEKRLVLCMIGA